MRIVFVVLLRCFRCSYFVAFCHNLNVIMTVFCSVESAVVSWRLSQAYILLFKRPSFPELLQVGPGCRKTEPLGVGFYRWGAFLSTNQQCQNIERTRDQWHRRRKVSHFVDPSLTPDGSHVRSPALVSCSDAYHVIRYIVFVIQNVDSQIFARRCPTEISNNTGCPSLHPTNECQKHRKQISVV